MGALYHNSSGVSSNNTNEIEAKALHIDTIKLSHAYKFHDLPPPQELKVKDFEINTKERNSNSIITAHLKSNKFNPFYLIVIKSGSGYCGIIIELSIAKLLDGNGLEIQTDEDIEAAFDGIEYIINKNVGVDFNSRTAKIGRLDVNADFLVGEDRITSYIHSISNPTAKFIPATYADTTRQFYNKSKKLLVYGKYEEVKKQVKEGKATLDDLEAAKGLLRFEVSMRKSPISRLAQKLKVPAEASHLINLSVASQIISEGLHQLDLDRPKLSKKLLYAKLLNHFGDKAPAMLGIIKWHEVYGDNFWKDLGWSPSTYYRNRNKLMAANLWNIAPVEALPSLTLPDTYNNSTSLP
ncbi:MAG TPA: phage/plasmid replication protein [Pyrinomonadaceae bacterium]|jgi:hypothetical protein